MLFLLAQVGSSLPASFDLVQYLDHQEEYDLDRDEYDLDRVQHMIIMMTMITIDVMITVTMLEKW